MIASDGAGGAIVAWLDSRSGGMYIYAQRVDATGVPQWTANGVALCTAVHDRWDLQIVSDGAGGAIVAWDDYRSNTDYDIYAQRVDAAGVPQWTTNGVALSTATDDQAVPTIASDGAGGAIVIWHDYRNGETDIYAQRVNATGVPRWTADGVALCTAVRNQSNPKAVSDGAGGAVVTWQDGRDSNDDIYAQRVNASGLPQWTADGVALCANTSGQLAPTIASDGAGGGIVTWRDGRSGARGIYAQRVSASGVAQWTADGVALSTAGTFLIFQTIVSDGAGGAIVTWQDDRSGTNYDIYARRVDASGVPQWTANGVAVCTAANSQYLPQIVTDGAGGAIVTWTDVRSGTLADIYAQRVSTSGVPQWAADGVAVCTAVSDKGSPTIAEDGAGGAIITWEDYRNGPIDIYAQRLNASGETPTAVAGSTRGPSLLVGPVYPNPFSATARMDVELTAPSVVRIEVFNVAGQRVRVTTLRDAVAHRVEFDGRDDRNRLLPSGVYFCRVEVAGEATTRKMVIAR